MIVADDLVKDYGPFRAVDHISFKVEPGEILGFLGPNGAGKSTTMKMITGFLAPTSGTARIGGHDVRERPLEAKRLLGYLPESGPLYQEMRVSEFLRFAAEVRGFSGAKREDVVADAAATCRLGEVLHQTIETLSKGFRQRVGLAQAILHDPACLILDEPTDGLDPNQKQEVRHLISRMAANKAIILSTHILEEVEAMCSRVIIVDRGKLLVDCPPAELRARHPLAGAIDLALADNEAEAIGPLENLESVRKVERHVGFLRLLPVDKGLDLQPAVWELARARGWSVRRLEVVPTPLDAVFRELTLPLAS